MLSSWLILCKKRMWKLIIKKYTSCITLCNYQLTKYDLFYKENLYYITLHIPKPHGSLKVTHTTNVHDKYALHHSFKKIQSSYNTKAKPQNTFNASKQHSVNIKAMLKHYFQHKSSDLHLKVNSQLSRKVYNHLMKKTLN